MSLSLLIFVRLGSQTAVKGIFLTWPTALTGSVTAAEMSRLCASCLSNILHLIVEIQQPVPTFEKNNQDRVKVSWMEMKMLVCPALSHGAPYKHRKEEALTKVWTHWTMRFHVPRCSWRLYHTKYPLYSLNMCAGHVLDVENEEVIWSDVIICICHSLPSLNVHLLRYHGCHVLFECRVHIQASQVFVGCVTRATCRVYCKAKPDLSTIKLPCCQSFQAFG